MPRVLYTSKDIREAIHSLFAAPAPGDRRVALVAYVGAQASKFLKDPDGLEIICALETGATSARGLERLQNRGARIQQSNRLHMKVHYSSTRGAVICSANATSNGLSGLGLLEAGVFLRPGDVDIERLIRYADPRAISSDDLRSLEREHEKLAAKCQRPIPMESRVKRTFRQWDSSELRTQWKIQAAGPEEAELAAEFAEYGITNDENWHQIINTRHGWLTPGDWVLCFNCVAAQQSFFWMYVDHVVSVDPDSKAFESGYGDQAVQIGPENVYNDPPFKLSPKTRTWIFKAIEEMGPEKLDNCADITAPPELIEAIRQYL